MLQQLNASLLSYEKAPCIATRFGTPQELAEYRKSA
jgi:hypothetical protein